MMLTTYATPDTFRCVPLEQLAPIINELVSIEWPCPEDNIQGIIERLGWTFLSKASRVQADTHLPVSWPLGDFAKVNGFLEELFFDVSTRLSNEDAVSTVVVSEAYLGMIEGLASILGESSGEESDENGHATWWDLPTGGRLLLDRPPEAITIRVMSQRYADADRFRETHDMSIYHDDED